MRGVLKRNATVWQILQTHGSGRNHYKKITDVYTDPVARISSSHLKNKTQSRDYYKLTDLFRRTTTRAYNEVSPYASSLFSSAFSSSSTRVVSFSEVGFVGWYLGMIRSRPVLTKSVTCSIIYTAADLSSQTIASSEPYDLVRTSRMAGYGMLILGPTLHFWYSFVSKLFPKQDLIATFKKMAMGQTIYGPIMTVVFLSMNAFLQGESGEEVAARLKRDLLPTLLSGVMYWPICDFITFRFIPVHLQPLVSNSFSYLWTIYMTYMASLEKAGPLQAA